LETPDSTTAGTTLATGAREQRLQLALPGKLSKAKYRVHDALLYKKCGPVCCLVVPSAMVPLVLREMHDSPPGGHMGVERLEVNTRRHYYCDTRRHARS
jgi:hypothetical protein